MFSTLPTTNFNCSVSFILSSANVLNWDQSKILSFGKELKKPTCHKYNYFALFACLANTLHCVLMIIVPGSVYFSSSFNTDKSEMFFISHAFGDGNHHISRL